MRKHFVILTGMLAACGGAPGQTQPSTSIVDYVVQNVCIDSTGRVLSGDPAACLSSRDIRSGEVPPYVLSDLDKANGQRYQSVSSIPENGDRVRILKQMADGDGFHMDFLPRRDGFDLIELDGTFVSAIATSDPGCGKQILSDAGDGDGWILFPAQLPISAGSTRHDMTLTRVTEPLPPDCPAQEVVSSTTSVHAVWTGPTPFTFESGKTLQTIKTEHHAHFDLSRTNNAIETMFFTREYGWSRWEAWIPLTRCEQEYGPDAPACFPHSRANILRGRCDPDTGVATRDGRRWVRIDCRDNTFHTARVHE